MKLINDVYRENAKVGRFLGVLIIWGIAYGLNRGIQDNYLAEIIQFTPFERGIVEFFRELPGLLVVLILALLYKFTASRIFKMGIAIMTAGIGGMLIIVLGQPPMIKLFVIIFMVIFSTGEHIMMPVRSTISMDLARREKTGIALGINGSISQLGNIIGLLIVTALFIVLGRYGYSRNDLMGFRIIFAASFALFTASSMIVLALEETKLNANRRRFYFARKYTKYYMMEVFYGARKQIFITFAPYVMVLHYETDSSIMALLLALCAGCGILLSPVIGRIIDKLGYKVVMVADTLLLIVVCLLYGYAHQWFPYNIARIIVYANFILDSIISMGSMANNVYVQRISANQEEITATLSTGISVNHVISIFIALMGGWVWRQMGFEQLFTLSAFLGVISSVYAATIKKSEEYIPDKT